jgi:hypothetical protein
MMIGDQAPQVRDEDGAFSRPDPAFLVAPQHFGPFPRPCIDPPRLRRTRITYGAFSAR